MDSFNKYLLSNMLGTGPSPGNEEINKRKGSKHLRASAAPSIVPTNFQAGDLFILNQPRNVHIIVPLILFPLKIKIHDFES